MMGTRVFAGSLLAALLMLAPPTPGTAQEGRAELRDGDTMKSILDRQVGKRVSLVLEASSAELGGTVVRVTDTAVHLSEIVGREFYDAVVRLDRITAVIMRVRGR